MELILEGLAKYAFSSRASAGWVTSLHAKILDQAMECESIIVAIFTKFKEI